MGMEWAAMTGNFTCVRRAGRRLFAPGLCFAAIAHLVLITGLVGAQAQEGTLDPGGGGAVEAPDKRIDLPINGTREYALTAPVRDIIIGNPDIADVIIRSPTKLFLAGKTVGSTNLFLLDANGDMVDHFQVSVNPDAKAAQDAIRAAFPEEMISITGAGDALVLKGSASSDAVSQQAVTIARRFVGGDAQLINTMRINAEQQVLIKISVAEVQKSALKELGLENLISPTTVGDFVIAGVTGGAGASVAGGFFNDLITGSTLTSAPAGAFFIDGPGAVDTVVRILEEHGLARKLAEPNLVAVSGEYATMLAGGEVPIPVNQDDDTITVEFRPFGVSLTFLPVVIDKGRISLKISTEVSAPTQTNAVSLGQDLTLPSFVVRRATSTVELPSGGSIMLAGLLNNDITQSLRGIPGLMHIPILGTLFRSTSFQQDESELVIVARAYLVQPTDPGVLSLPTDGFAPASDLDLYLLGHLQNIYTNRPGAAQDQVPQLQGPIGYIIR